MKEPDKMDMQTMFYSFDLVDPAFEIFVSAYGIIKYFLMGFIMDLKLSRFSASVCVLKGVPYR